jgi:LysM repeat protein
MERKRSATARLLALLGIGVAFVGLMFVLATSFSDGGSGDSDKATEGVHGQTEPGSGEREQQPGEQRFYTVKEGDTLTAISETTGVSVDDLENLNPGIDPQILTPGDRLRLR